MKNTSLIGDVSSDHGNLNNKWLTSSSAEKTRGLLENELFRDLVRPQLVNAEFQQGEGEDDDEADKREDAEEKLYHDAIVKSRVGRIYGQEAKLFINTLVPDMKVYPHDGISVPFLVDSLAKPTYFAPAALRMLRARANFQFTLYNSGKSIPLNCQRSAYRFKKLSILGVEFLQAAELSMFIDWQKREFMLTHLPALNDIQGEGWENSQEFSSLIAQHATELHDQLEEQLVLSQHQPPAAPIDGIIDKCMQERIIMGRYLLNIWEFVEENVSESDVQNALSSDSKGIYAGENLWPLICLPCYNASSGDQSLVCQLVFLVDTSWSTTVLTRSSAEELKLKLDQAVCINNVYMDVCPIKTGNLNILGTIFWRKPT
uniref:Uncharacterized protein n=1 Tax=Ditylenchus dipsaci TaxID=166011 RepID=A0A915EN17_9BILA